MSDRRMLLSPEDWRDFRKELLMEAGHRFVPAEADDAITKGEGFRGTLLHTGIDRDLATDVYVL